MKKSFLIIFIACIIMGCSNKKLTHKETVIQYYKARNTVDFSKIKPLVNDSVTIISGDYVMPYNKDGFYEVFKWDSVFKPSYKIVDLQEKNNHVTASVTINSVRNTFLNNSDMTCQYKIAFKANKITKIEEVDCKNVDWQVWIKERDSLVNWTKKNHPKLDGFINDMTMKGALNYLKAIELYKANTHIAKQ